MMGPNGWHGGGMGAGGWIVVAVLMVIFWAVVVAAVVALLRYKAHGPGGSEPAPPATDDSALRILDERFARGEIDEDEYVKRRNVLRPR